MKKIVTILMPLFAVGVFIFAYCFSDTSRIAEVIGGCAEKSSPYMVKYFNDDRKITYCDGGDKYIGEIRSKIIEGRSEIVFSYAGYTSNDGVELQLISDGFRVLNIDLPSVGERWVEYRLKIPKEFVNTEIELVATDRAVDKFGWIGLGNVGVNEIDRKLSFILKVVSISIYLLVFYAVGLNLLVPKYGMLDAPVVLVVFVGILGYGVFYLYVINRWIGNISSILLVATSIIYSIRMCKNDGWVNFSNALQFLMPIVFITLIIVVIGYYPFEFTGKEFWQNGANRWLNLPIDSWLPKIFADQIYKGELLRPMYGDWLSSDRPPLQTGIYLIFYPFGKGDDVIYQVVSTMLQAMILIAIWRFIMRFKLTSAQRWILFSFSLSSLFIVNSLFVWPKLISASYVLICFYYLNFGVNSKFRNFMVGSSVSLAMLSHGGAFFALLGIFLYWGAMNIKNTSWSIIKDLVIWAVIALVLYYPWILYGKYYDPQYSRLVKWHLAGLIEPSRVGVISTLYSAYSEISFGEWFASRVSNFNVIVKDFILFEPFLWSGQYSEFVKSARDKSFFNLFYSLWFLSPFVVFFGLLLFRYRKIEVDLMKLFYGALFGLFFWILLMFEPGSTVVHQGSYYGYVALFIFGQISLYLLNKNIFHIANILNIGLSLMLYVFSPLRLVDDIFYVMGVMLTLVLFWNSLAVWNADRLTRERIF
jgi:hypothetical protein